MLDLDSGLHIVSVVVKSTLIEIAVIATVDMAVIHNDKAFAVVVIICSKTHVEQNPLTCYTPIWSFSFSKSPNTLGKR